HQEVGMTNRCETSIEFQLGRDLFTNFPRAALGDGVWLTYVVLRMSKQHLRQPRLFSFGLVRKSHLRPCSSPVAVRWPSGHADVLVHVQDDADAVMTSKLPAAERRALVRLASASHAGAADQRADGPPAPRARNALASVRRRIGA